MGVYGKHMLLKEDGDDAYVIEVMKQPELRLKLSKEELQDLYNLIHDEIGSIGILEYDD